MGTAPPHHRRSSPGHGDFGGYRAVTAERLLLPDCPASRACGPATRAPLSPRRGSRAELARTGRGHTRPNAGLTQPNAELAGQNARLAAPRPGLQERRPVRAIARPLGGVSPREVSQDWVRHAEGIDFTAVQVAAAA